MSQESLPHNSLAADASSADAREPLSVIEEKIRHISKVDPGFAEVAIDCSNGSVTVYTTDMHGSANYDYVKVVPVWAKLTFKPALLSRRQREALRTIIDHKMTEMQELGYQLTHWGVRAPDGPMCIFVNSTSLPDREVRAKFEIFGAETVQFELEQRENLRFE
jgi:hypothetical protein